ncbi:unnamed protein product [Lactuca saligna]|uniref:phosphopyruvate hydratase n=1 Tax=Lactuca saligna TaxID=75948 RepID=A0AA35Y6U7_LACSI|nr:unnamed protein product [Lactuca saligna]
MIPLFINSNGQILKFQHIQVFGDELLMSNPKNIERAIEEHACDAVLFKVNQVGSTTEAIKVVKMENDDNWGTIELLTTTPPALLFFFKHQLPSSSSINCLLPVFSSRYVFHSESIVSIGSCGFLIPCFQLVVVSFDFSILIEYEILWLIRSATHVIFQLTWVSRLRCLLSPTWQRNQVITSEFEIASSLPASKIFNAYRDFNNIAPKVDPETYKILVDIEGDGGAGTIRDISFGDGVPFTNGKLKLDVVDSNNFSIIYTIFEGDILMGQLDSMTHHVKFIPSPDGGCVYKPTVVYNCKEMIVANYKSPFNLHSSE